MSEIASIVPDDVTTDWHPDNYVVPDYDDPGDFDERPDGCLSVEEVK